MLILNLIYFILSGIILVISGGFLVKSLSKISKFLKISEFTVAFIIMAIATSIPELFVGISSALSNTASLSLGNVIGANILNLTLITGIIILLSKEIKIGEKKISDDLEFMLATLIIVIILYSIGKSLSRLDGFFLIIIFIINIYRKFIRREKYPKPFKEKTKKGGVTKNIIIFIISLITLFLSSRYAVKYASFLAIDLNFPKIIMGLFLLSLATTLPELIFGISATRLKHNKMGLGNAVGSVIVNSTLVLGVVAIISPIKADFIPFITAAIFMLFSAFIFYIFTKTGKRLKSIEGIGLILTYVLFMIIEFFIK